jgi:DNA polymerase (family 10)
LRNLEVADLLDRISLLLEASGEERFKVIAYRRAGTSIRNLTEDIEDVWRSQRLEEIPYVGEGIAKKIDEYLRTGKLRYLETLEQKVPSGVVELMKIPGVGPRTAYKLAKEFGITSLEDLQRALQEDELKPLGAAFRKRTLEEIEKMKTRGTRMLLSEALFLSEILIQYFAGKGITVEAAGSLRRGKSTVGDIDLLSTKENSQEVLASFPDVEKVLEKGPTRASVVLNKGVQIDIRIVKPDEYGAALVYFTGSKEHGIALRNLAIDRDWKLNEYGIFEAKSGKRLAGKTETEVYGKLGLEFIPPELRENTGEIEAAKEGKLPRLIKLQNLKGDLQMHSTWSDGSDKLEKMAAAAQVKGYVYMAITDHSFSATIAHGLSEERFREQWKIIDALNERLAPFRVLKGVEAEVRGDGTLDYDRKFLDEFDIVGASIHQGFRQSPEKLTERAAKALSHPSVDFLCHPTNRLIGKREGHPLDLRKVIATARDNGKMLEIDGDPHRLDLDEIWARKAIEEGVLLVIDSDAHSVQGLDSLFYGVIVARRAWVEPKNVANTLSLSGILRG